MTIVSDYSEKIPNNVNLREDRRLQRALESWHPDFLNWWESMDPALPTRDVYLRTAVNVGREGWAHFGHVPMKDYRWGIFPAERDSDRRIAFGQHKGEPAWQKVPGEYRADLQRLLVIQGDTEPASVEQQRTSALPRPACMTCATCSRSTWRRGGTCGRWCTCCTPTSAGRDARKPENCCTATPAARTPRASWARSTRRPRTGCRSTCSPTSPTGTASTSSAR